MWEHISLVLWEINCTQHDFNCSIGLGLQLEPFPWYWERDKWDNYRQIRQTYIKQTFTLWSKEPFRQQYTAPAAREDYWYFFLNLPVQCFMVLIRFAMLTIYYTFYEEGEVVNKCRLKKFQTFPRLLKTPSNVDQTKSVCAGLRRGLFEWMTDTDIMDQRTFGKSWKFHIRLPTH